ncbi:ATP-binding cassette, subfamily C, CydC [Salinihabitans flavidus]|uniref:ATP-binding cassette, subfamily C, CydC n=1 Tax=Salinihabitans flavidus TaxID=569882 RepID=A0A1H8RBD7_9RHOB|nr:ATP-binding cassette domain-containing protein [Salinihabitans flavidus]SEO63839.1 ATP-binding cassette, subfamily C, CydC [Salinihabitans flavidus]
MSRLWRATRLLWSADPWAMTRGAAAAVAVLAMGAALLGLSGWFITATGAAGLAGIGIAFDVFRPSAGVRFLALGRAGARYAERLLTHDATLRALTRLRVVLMRRLERWPVPKLRRLRGAVELTRITADVDALDGLVLRLVLPLMAGALTHVGVFAVLAWLSSLPVALTIAGGYSLGAAVILWRVARRGFAPSAEAERRIQDLAREAIGLFRGQRDVLLQARLPSVRGRMNDVEAKLCSAQKRLDRLDRDGALALTGLITLVTGATLLLSGVLVGQGDVSPALAALGVFVALALGESVLPLRRGLAELGRIRDAADRVFEDARPSAPEEATSPPGQPDPEAGLCLRGIAIARAGRADPLLTGLDLDLRRGETVALLGVSGMGKSTLLDAIAGLVAVSEGGICVLGLDLEDWPGHALRERLTLVAQRSALIGGAIRDNLSLAGDDLDDAAMWDALRAVRLDGVLEGRGGLDATLGEGGRGLSGGEARRLALARALLRRPDVLLLDEPTEGLDDALARQVLNGIRDFLPHAAILTASHRSAETDAADRVVNLERCIPNNEYS